MTTFVYLILSEKRLVITQNPINSKNYYKLMDTDAFNGVAMCKMFCIGYLMGNSIGRESSYTILNDVREFA